MDNIFFSSTVLLAAFAGGIIFALMYILKLFNNNHETNEDHEKNDKCAQHSEKKKESVGGKAKKKVSESKWSSKTEKQGFTHPWLIKSFKGHTGEVLGVDISSNNKYLISCADEDPEDPGGSSTESNTSSVESIKDNSLPASTEASPKVKGLSRRQRKNRRKEDISPETKIKAKKKQASQPAVSMDSNIFWRLNMSEAQLYSILCNYVVEPNMMYFMGYPMSLSKGNGHVLIYKAGRKQPGFDVNAAEFIPKTGKNDDYDSGHGSGHSSDSGEANEDSPQTYPYYRICDVSELNCRLTEAVQINLRGHVQFHLPVYPPPGTKMEPTSVDFVDRNDGSALLLLTAVCVPDAVSDINTNSHVQRKHTCVRCSKSFYTKNTEYVPSETCRYHWGKLYKRYSSYSQHQVYECCCAYEGSTGCTESRYHVWTGFEDGPNHLTGFVRTKHRKSPPANGCCGIFALDCEMSFTVAGLELTKVTVVAVDSRIVYDTFVKPENEVLDYNTRFSGVTSKNMINAKSLKQVQNDLMGFINAETILVGHGLENDLRALKIVHRKVVDTCHTFPHHLGLPYRRSLKQLARVELKKEIQTYQHNSFEDAVTALELILSLVKRTHCLY